MEGADVGRGLAEEADAELVAASILVGKRHAGRQRNVAADDPVPSQESGGGVEDMHRAALAARRPGRLPEQLGHYCAAGEPAGQRVAVFAVGADDVIVGSERGHDAHRHRFLADVEVAESADLAERVGLAGLFLEPPDQQHLAEIGSVERLGGRVGGLLRTCRGGHGVALVALAWSTCSQAW